MAHAFPNLPRDRGAGVLAFAALSALTACSDGSSATVGVGPSDTAAAALCNIPQEQIFSGQRKDGIPALTDPEMAFAGQAGTEYLNDDDRVIGLIFEGEAIAVPLNIMWWYEVVNLNGATSAIAVTHCPLTGSSLAFDRLPVSWAEFGVSGLLFQNNLIMYDRASGDDDQPEDAESIWPQMLRRAACGPKSGTPLPMVPIVETTWHGWRELHPDTKVVTRNTGFHGDYTIYPYGDYDFEQNRDLLFPISGPIDGRRPPKERILGIPIGTGGFAFPLGELDEMGEAAVVNESGFVVLWERAREGAMAFRPELDGVPITLEAADGRIVDLETNSEWRMDGRAISGPLAGRSLPPVEEAFVSYWFAWSAFYPDSQLWSAP